jgi:hypothetical protein
MPPSRPRSGASCAFKRDIAPTAVVIENLLKQKHLVRDLITPLIRHRGMHRQRMLNGLQRAFPAAEEVRIARKEILEIAWLSPKPPIIVDGKGGEQ